MAAFAHVMIKWDETDLTELFGVVATFHDDAHSHSFEVSRDGLRLLMAMEELAAIQSGHGADREKDFRLRHCAAEARTELIHRCFRGELYAGLRGARDPRSIKSSGEPTCPRRAARDKIMPGQNHG
jgi:hypothetical protein